MSKKDKLNPQDAPPNVQRGGAAFSLRKLVSSLAGAELCYGEPVRSGERIVIPVARVSAWGGGGFGRGDNVDGDSGNGGGGGGQLDAAPAGFIEIGPEGARFEPIPDPMTTARALRTAAGAVSVLATGLTALAAARRGRRRRGELGAAVARRALSR